MFALQSNITIGTFTGIKPNNVNIKKSIYEYVDKAIIKLPASARLTFENKDVVVSAETAKQFNESDKVLIQLGYNGSLKTEFEGFVSRINYTQPVEVECEGYSYQLRKKQYTGTQTKVELKALLQILIAGTDIILDANTESFVIDKIILEGKTGTSILEEIKDLTKGRLRFHFIGKILFGGLIYIKPNGLSVNTTADVKYKLGWNVIKDNNLKYRTASSINTTVIYKGHLKNGTVVQAQSGDGSGELITVDQHDVTDQASLQKLADAHRSSLSYDGYEGKITGFLQPYCEHGYKAFLIDDKYQERNGNYLVDSIEVSYGMQGARRSVGIAFKL